MTSQMLLLMFSIIILLKMSSGRYIVPDRPPVDLNNTTHNHPELEFRDHALRVGNIIADLLRSEIRLMLNINTTIANGKKHHDHSREKGKNHDHHHDKEAGEHEHFTESTLHESHKSSEERHVEVIHSTEPMAVERPVNSHKVPEHTHTGNPNNKNYKETKSVPENYAGKHINSHSLPKPTHSHEHKNKSDDKSEKLSKNQGNCACSALKNSVAQPNTLMLEQKLYGAYIFNGSFQPDYSSPLIIQRFIFNPSNLSKSQASLHQEHGQSSNHDYANPKLFKPFTRLTPQKGNSHSKVISENNNHDSNPHSKSHDVVPEEISSDESTPETSYNPLAGIAETSNDLTENVKSQDIQAEQEINYAYSDSLANLPLETESQVESPGLELVETTITEKPREEVREEFIHVQNADEE